jgi:hypothetical protein
VEVLSSLPFLCKATKRGLRRYRTDGAYICLFLLQGTKRTRTGPTEPTSVLLSKTHPLIYSNLQRSMGINLVLLLACEPEVQLRSAKANCCSCVNPRPGRELVSYASSQMATPSSSLCSGFASPRAATLGHRRGLVSSSSPR